MNRAFISSISSVASRLAGRLAALLPNKVAKDRAAKALIPTAGLACLLVVAISASTLAEISLPKITDKLDKTLSLSPVLENFAERLTPKIKQIQFTNAQHISEDELNAALNFRLGDPIWATDLNMARESLTQLAWVRDAELHRGLGGTVTIQIVERTPCARHQRDGVLHLIDTQGVTLPQGDMVRQEFRQLPALVGQGAEAGCAFWSEWKAAVHSLDAQLLAASRVRDRRWDLFLGSGVVLALPEEDWRRALSLLVRLERDYGLVSYVRDHGQKMQERQRQETQQVQETQQAQETQETQEIGQEPNDSAGLVSLPTIDLRVRGFVRLRGIALPQQEGA